MNNAKQKPPPKTTLRKIVIKKSKTPQMDIDVHAEVLADTKNTKITGGETSFRPVGKLSGNKLYSTPGYSWMKKAGAKIVSKLSGPAEIKGTIKIQTAYNPKANPADKSEYGRGTTPEDEKSGNTSLGFHEYCHRNDYITYLQTKDFPTFTGKVGMTEHQYKQSLKSFVQAMDNYFKEMEKYSYRLTDEVGYKKSTFKSKGSRP
jgi:hypothetical protein